MMATIGYFWLMLVMCFYKNKSHGFLTRAKHRIWKQETGTWHQEWQAAQCMLSAAEPQRLTLDKNVQVRDLVLEWHRLACDVTAGTPLSTALQRNAAPVRESSVSDENFGERTASLSPTNNYNECFRVQLWACFSCSLINRDLPDGWWAHW